MCVVCDGPCLIYELVHVHCLGWYLGLSKLSTNTIYYRPSGSLGRGCGMGMVGGTGGDWRRLDADGDGAGAPERARMPSWSSQPCNSSNSSFVAAFESWGPRTIFLN